MRSKFSLGFWLIVLPLLSCCSSEGRWITREELKPASDPNIEAVQLQNGSVIQFDKDLGWYDVEAQIIEGKLSGAPIRISLSEVKYIELLSGANAMAIVTWIFLGTLLLGIALWAAIILWLGHGGG